MIVNITRTWHKIGLPRPLRLKNGRRRAEQTAIEQDVRVFLPLCTHTYDVVPSIWHARVTYEKTIGISHAEHFGSRPWRLFRTDVVICTYAYIILHIIIQFNSSTERFRETFRTLLPWPGPSVSWARTTVQLNVHAKRLESHREKSSSHWKKKLIVNNNETKFKIYFRVRYKRAIATVEMTRGDGGRRILRISATRLSSGT